MANHCIRGARAACAAIVLFAIGCGGSSGGGPSDAGSGSDAGGNSQVATPTFSPAGGTYAVAQDVTIACATSGAAIHYTTDGSTPTANSATYSAPVHVAATATLKAYAVASGQTDSAVASASFTINAGATPAAAPTFSPNGGTFASAQSVTIATATAGASIYFTTDGSTPTTSSALYGAPISLSASETLTAIAVASGYARSASAQGAYVISTGSDFPTLCAQIFTRSNNLQESCVQANPAFFASAGPYNRNDCAGIAAEITAGRVHYDSSQGSSCAAAVQALTCDTFTTSFPASCSAALVGQVAVSGTCYVDADCAGGFCTASHSSSCPGTCQAYATSGQSCASSVCATGLVCDYAGGAICKTPSGNGGACPCQAGYWCDSSGASPTCKPPIAANGACTSSGACAVGYACAGASGSMTCQAIVGANGSCAAASQVCGQGYACTNNVCVSWPTVNQACSASGPPCAGGWCNTAASSPTCAAYIADGQTCTPSLGGSDCASGHCDVGSSKCLAAYCSP